MLTTAYKAPDCAPSLILLTSPSQLTNSDFGKEATSPTAIPSTIHSEFLNKSPINISKILRDNTKVSDTVFLLADKQTVTDGTVLLVVRDPSGGALETVRLSEQYMNSQAICVDVAVTDVGEIISLADPDGVFRGGPRSEESVQQGGAAPRKRLGT